MVWDNWEIKKELVEERLSADPSMIGNKIYVLDSVDSTNKVCKEMGKEGEAHGTVILAKEQTAGRGRLGRGWHSGKNQGIYMSILLKPDLAPDKASFITLLAALAVNKAICTVTGLKSSIKWPNDIVMNGKKICGILTEMSTQGEKLEYVVLGIGINVNNDFIPDELFSSATSLKIEGGAAVDMNEMAASIIKECRFYLSEFFKASHFFFVEEYNKNLVNINKTVSILEGQREYRGRALGINDRGALLVERHDTGNVEEIVSGEVSVRGIYGYV